MVGYAAANPFAEYVLPNQQWVITLGITNLFFLIGIPLLGLIRYCYRLLSREKLQMKSWAAPLITLFVINAFSWASVMSVGFREFKMSSSLSENIPLTVTGDQLELKSIGSVFDNDNDFPLFESFQFDDDKLICNFLELDILQSEGDQFELVQRNQARGNTISEARALARELPLQGTVVDSVLNINTSFVVPKGSKFRAQTIKLTLKVPKGKSIKINDDLARSVHHIDLKDRHVGPWRWQNETWTMEEDGLVCSDCDGYAKEENNDLTYTNFSKVNIDGMMKVEIEKGDQYKVRVTGKEAYTKKVEVNQMGETLHISTDLNRTGSPIRVFLTMPKLEALSVENTDDVKINGFEEKRMSIRNNGRHDIKAYVIVDTLTVKQEGRNELDIRGKGKFIKVDMDGRTKLDAEHFAVNNAVVDLRIGSHSSAKMSVTDTLKRMGDIGAIRFDGDPVVVDNR